MSGTRVFESDHETDFVTFERAKLVIVLIICKGRIQKLGTSNKAFNIFRDLPQLCRLLQSGHPHQQNFLQPDLL